MLRWGCQCVAGLERLPLASMCGDEQKKSQRGRDERELCLQITSAHHESTDYLNLGIHVALRFEALFAIESSYSMICDSEQGTNHSTGPT